MKTNIVGIVIPTYNEAKNLPKLLARLEVILASQPHLIVVVDDHSPDGTAQIAREIGKKKGNILVKERDGKNGIGSAVRDGLILAMAMPRCQTIITMDGDLSSGPRSGGLPSLHVGATVVRATDTALCADAGGGCKHHVRRVSRIQALHTARTRRSCIGRSDRCGP